MNELVTNPPWIVQKTRGDNTNYYMMNFPRFLLVRYLRSWLLLFFSGYFSLPTTQYRDHRTTQLGRHLGIITSYSLLTADWTRAKYLSQAGPMDFFFRESELGLRETKFQSGCFLVKKDVTTRNWQEQCFAPWPGEQRKPISHHRRKECRRMRVKRWRTGSLGCKSTQLLLPVRSKTQLLLQLGPRKVPLYSYNK